MPELPQPTQATTTPYLEADVRYQVRFKGWIRGTLVLKDNTLSFQSENGDITFRYPISEITEVVDRHIGLLGIKAKDNIGLLNKALGWGEHSIAFGNVYMPQAGDAAYFYQNKKLNQAISIQQPWVDYFKSEGLLVEGFNYYRFGGAHKKVLVALFIFIIIIVSISALSSR